MTEQRAYLDRMTSRLGDIAGQIDAMTAEAERSGDPSREKQARDLEAQLGVLRERLQVMRRNQADLAVEDTQSFAQAFERLKSAVARVHAG